jgi:hypothetical protein
MKIIRWVFYRILQSLEPSKPQKSWAEWWSYVFSSNIPQLTLHFLCNLQLQRQFLKQYDRVNSTSFSARVKLEMFTMLGIEWHCSSSSASLTDSGVSCKLLSGRTTPKCIKMCCTVNEPRDQVCLGLIGTVPFAGRLLEHIYTVKRAKASNSVN